MHWANFLIALSFSNVENAISLSGSYLWVRSCAISTSQSRPWNYTSKPRTSVNTEARKDATYLDFDLLPLIEETGGAQCREFTAPFFHTKCARRALCCRLQRGKLWKWEFSFESHFSFLGVQFNFFLKNWKVLRVTNFPFPDSHFLFPISWFPFPISHFPFPGSHFKWEV